MNSSEIYYNLLKEAQKEKIKINKETLLKTKKLYGNSLNEIIKKLERTDSYNQQWIKGQIEVLSKKLDEINKTIEDMAVKGITETSKIMTDVNGDFFSYLNKKYNLDIDPNLLESLYSTNQNVINKIVEGGLYKDNKSLSERIWNYSGKNINDVQNILLKGMIQKKPIQEIINELNVYTGGGNSNVAAIKRTYGNMNYNALRLLRTSLNHAFTETMKDECRYNPFVEGYKWELSGVHDQRMHGMTDICDEYANSDEYNMGRGVYPKNVDRYIHPNCLCIQTPYITKSMEDIADEINKWIKDEKNNGIDKWIRSSQ